jgi:hypothetical protein
MYYCNNLFDVYSLSRVCSVWRAYLQSEDSIYIWNSLKGGEKINNFKEIKKYLQGYLIEQK